MNLPDSLVYFQIMKEQDTMPGVRSIRCTRYWISSRINRSTIDTLIAAFIFPFVYLVTPNQCLAPADQFVVGKWFCQIIITTTGKAKCLIAFLCAGT